MAAADATNGMKHATVKIGDYTVPLIGIPEDATQQVCDKCGRSVHLSDIVLDEAFKPHCARCINNNRETTQVMKTKTKATKKPRTTRLEAKLKKLNAAYRKASPVQRRKMIAKDCLEQIREKKFYPTNGVFSEVVLTTDSNGDNVHPRYDQPLQPLLHRPSTHCECCGAGAIFLSYVRLANEATEADGHGLSDIQRATDWPKDNLRLIELAFEQGRGVSQIYTKEDGTAAAFGRRERLRSDPDARLKAILTNIIDSKDGLFHP